jgi:hypothetical protein
LVPGIGKKSAQKFLAQLNQEEFSLEKALDFLSSQKSAKIRAGMEPLTELLQQLQNPDLAPATRLNLALAYYEPILKTHFDDYPKRLRDLEHLLSITARYRVLGDFLNDLTWAAQQYGGNFAPGDTTLSTFIRPKDWNGMRFSLFGPRKDDFHPLIPRNVPKNWKRSGG